MNVNAASGAYGQMNIGQMYGYASGNGSGNGQEGMKEIMQSLSNDERSAIREQMQALPQEDRLAMKEQLKAVNSTDKTSDDYFQSLLDILSQTDEVEETTGFSVYA